MQLLRASSFSPASPQKAESQGCPVTSHRSGRRRGGSTKRITVCQSAMLIVKHMNDRMNIAIAGSSGRMGRALARSRCGAPDLRLTAALERAGSPYLQKDAGELIGAPCGIHITEDLLRAFRKRCADRFYPPGRNAGTPCRLSRRKCENGHWHHRLFARAKRRA